MSVEIADDDEDSLLRASSARVGRVVAGKWRLLEVIGVGGTAAVYGALSPDGSAVAIKILHPQYALMPSVRRRFSREGAAVNALEHPGVVPILEHGVSEGGEAFLVMERLVGQSLAERLKEGPLAREVALAIASSVLDVLAVAHDRGVIHRDVKPANVFLCSDGAVKLLDFGIASIRDGSESPSLVTRPGSLRGTPSFMAPELARGATELVDCRVDVWAAGALLFRALTGQAVHRGRGASQMLVMAATQAARPVRSVDASVPPAIASVVDRALRFERDARWPDARAMGEALSAASHAVPSNDAADEDEATFEEGDAAPRPPRRLWPAAGLVAALALAAVSLVSLRAPPDAPPVVAPLAAPVVPPSSPSASAVFAASPPPDPPAPSVSAVIVAKPRPSAAAKVYEERRWAAPAVSVDMFERRR